MAFISDLQTALDAVRGAVGDEVDAAAIPALMQQLGDDALVSLVACTTALIRGGESVRIAATGVIAARSTRAAGHGGVAQKRGHGSAVSLIQDLTGTTRADAAKQVRLGTALAESLGGTGRAGDDRLTGEATDAGAGTDAAGTAAGVDGTAGSLPNWPWHAVLGDALMTGTITSAQHDAIYRGLGEPPTPTGCCCTPNTTPCPCGCPGRTPNSAADTIQDTTGGVAGESATSHMSAAHRAVVTGVGVTGGCGCATAVATAARDAWETAATQLIDEAAVRTVEELASSARSIRDLLDPVGANARFDARYQGRSFRTWLDHTTGTRRGTIVFDDEGAAWVEAIINTALRPRRGGPRFVDPDEKARADELVADPRTNDQLSYDLLLDLLRTGALADADTVFGTRQAGVRIVTTAATHADILAGRPAAALLEETDTSVPGWLAARHTCHTGTTPVLLDENLNPLDLGREARLYTGRQRIALAIRDGGCRIPGCDRPASSCEAHHIDEWAADHGRTDIDRGILLCTFHHMNVHHHGWRITRQGKGDFILHRPGHPPIPLPERLPRRYAFGNLTPPPPRFHPAA